MLLFIRHVARRIRHLPGLERSDSLWNTLRPGYLRLLNLGGQGIAVSVGGRATIRMPPEYVAASWETYEPEAVGAAAKWAKENPGGLFLDVGCHVGLFSAVALFSGRDIEAIAFDSDLGSLAETYCLCRHAPGKLRAVHGFVTQSGQGLALVDVELGHAPENAAPARYTNLGDGNPGLPENALDDLFRDYPTAGRAILLKADIEGAELMMLRGGRSFIEKHKPSMLLSIHPTILPDFGHSPEDVRDQLRNWGYDIQVLAIDHEEHWWCSCR
jgi:FkbM family methyltransferase